LEVWREVNNLSPLPKENTVRKPPKKRGGQGLPRATQPMIVMMIMMMIMMIMMM
jgi:hypothetical protein